MHIDPLGTSAWNTVVSGRKLWVLFPPHVDKSVARGKEMIRQGEDDEPVRANHARRGLGAVNTRQKGRSCQKGGGRNTKLQLQ